MVNRTTCIIVGLATMAGCGGGERPATAHVVTLPPAPASSSMDAGTSGADASEPASYGMIGLLNGGNGGSEPPPDADAGARHHPPSIRTSSTTVSAGLPPEVIQRIVRQNFGRFRLCYENGLRKDPALAGRVTVRFIIDSTGGVAQANKTSGTTLPDADVVRCVVRSFSNLSFPQPSTGSVDVVYPIEFAP